MATAQIETPGGGGFTCGLANPKVSGSLALGNVYEPAAIPGGTDLQQQMTLVGFATVPQSTPNTTIVLECLPLNGNSYIVDFVTILATQVTNINVQ